MTTAWRPARAASPGGGKELVSAYFGNKSKDVDPATVKNLRRKLETALPERDLIHAVYGVGYKYSDA